MMSYSKYDVMSDEAEHSALLPLIVADVYELAGRFRAEGESIAATVRQTQARWQVMSAASAEPLSVPRIARVLGVTRQNVQRIADLLVEEGSAQYQDNPDHRASPHLILARPTGRCGEERRIAISSRT